MSAALVCLYLVRMEFDMTAKDQRADKSTLANSTGKLVFSTSGLTRVHESPFLCPESTQAISRAVHLARLNAAWPNCDQCEWRTDSEGLAEKTLQATERIRDHRGAGLHRTEFGVRGPYINELDRRTAADLARIFASCVNELAMAADQEPAPVVSIRAPLQYRPVTTTPPESAVPAKLIDVQSVVVGYDGRSSSPDIFVGVTAAIRELGLSVIDIGRCTAASIQEAARSLQGCAGIMFVTGAGKPASWAGLDVMDAHGESVPVVWKDFGVRLQHVTSNPSTAAPGEFNRADADSDGLSEVLRRIRGETEAATPRAPLTAHLRLWLPSIEDRVRWSGRLSRHSGQHEVVNFEPRYREWLTRWYPQGSSLRVLLRSDDPLIQERATWLAEQTGIEFYVRSLREDVSIPSCRFSMTVFEDDRQFVINDDHNSDVTPERLAVLINASIHSQSSQVTAHADAASGRFWLTDARRRSELEGTEHVRDALAILGLTMKLIESGRLNLRP
jgi:hypothetical protein